MLYWFRCQISCQYLWKSYIQSVSEVRLLVVCVDKANRISNQNKNKIWLISKNSTEDTLSSLFSALLTLQINSLLHISRLERLYRLDYTYQIIHICA